jgi:hypothetical protein
LLGRRIWDDEGARTRLFLLDLIREEQTSREEADHSRLLGRPPLDLQVHRDDPAGEPEGTGPQGPAEESP